MSSFALPAALMSSFALPATPEPTCCAVCGCLSAHVTTPACHPRTCAARHASASLSPPPTPSVAFARGGLLLSPDAAVAAAGGKAAAGGAAAGAARWCRLVTSTTARWRRHGIESTGASVARVWGLGFRSLQARDRERWCVCGEGLGFRV